MSKVVILEFDPQIEFGQEETENAVYLKGSVGGNVLQFYNYCLQQVIQEDVVVGFMTKGTTVPEKYLPKIVERFTEGVGAVYTDAIHVNTSAQVFTPDLYYGKELNVNFFSRNFKGMRFPMAENAYAQVLLKIAENHMVIHIPEFYTFIE